MSAPHGQQSALRSFQVKADPPYVHTVVPTVGPMDYLCPDYSRNCFVVRCVVWPHRLCPTIHKSTSQVRGTKHVISWRRRAEKVYLKRWEFRVQGLEHRFRVLHYDLVRERERERETTDYEVLREAQRVIAGEGGTCSLSEALDVQCLVFRSGI